MKRPGEPLFLARESYRRRRLADAAKVMPFVGVILLFLPVLWAEKGRTAGGMLYVFGVWALMILVVARVSTLLSRAPEEDPDDAELIDPKG